ncbi:MAG TPA: hypothetical protein DIW61_07470, partial [Candidatus Aminicenantes bacterium]|nr:hypothetical protein [Candidatus Aminicenantes bacterium]
MAMLIIPLFIFLLNVSPSASPAESPNLAREAQASASESYQTLSPEKANDGSAIRHLGKPGAKLPRVVIVSFPAEETERLRIGNITNGPSFSEVEAYSEPL